MRRRIAIALSLFLSSCISIGPLAAQPPVPRAAKPIALGLRCGLGCERETGRAFALEPRLGLDASWGRAYSYLELGQALGRLDWGSDLSCRALDVAYLGIGRSFVERRRLALRAEAQARYRSFGSAGNEFAFSALLGVGAGAVERPLGLAFRGAAGYSVFFSRLEGEETLCRDLGPLLLLGVNLKPSPRLLLNLAMTDYTGSDSGLFCKTFFELGASYRLERLSLGVSLTAKYTDFFTLTSYADGFALRASARIPLGTLRAGREPGLW
jgi:hypothetical protein